MNLRTIARLLTAAISLIAVAGCNSRPGQSLALTEQSEAANSPHVQPFVFQDEIKSDIYYLASDRLEGRGVETEGLNLAADFIATRFQSLGLKPLPGLDGYFQPFEITTAESIDPATTLASVEKTYKVAKDFTALSFSGEGEFSAPIAFAGYGVADPKNHYDDYADLDVKGKVVLVMRFEPHDDQGKSRWTKESTDDWTPNAHLESKARVAAEHGARALLLVNTPTFHDQGDDRLPPFSRKYVGGVTLPVLQVKRAVADQLLQQGGAAKLAELQKQIDHNIKPASADLNNVSIKGNVAIKRTKKTVKNVIAYLPGAGPHADEYVVVGSHYRPRTSPCKFPAKSRNCFRPPRRGMIAPPRRPPHEPNSPPPPPPAPSITARMTTRPAPPQCSNSRASSPTAPQGILRSAPSSSQPSPPRNQA